MTYKLNHSVFEEIITRLLQGEIRESLAVAIEEAIIQSEDLFLRLNAESKPVAGSTRKEISFHPQLIASIHRFTSLIASIEEELALESGLYSLDEFQLRIVEEHLEMMQLALGLFQKPDHVISWMSEEWTGPTLVVMPKMVQEVLRERVFAQNMPIIFSSATLSVEGSFDYIADSLGIEDYLSFSVASPYEYAEQMEAFVPPLSCTQPFAEKMDLAVSLLQKRAVARCCCFHRWRKCRSSKRLWELTRSAPPCVSGTKAMRKSAT